MTDSTEQSRATGRPAPLIETERSLPIALLRARETVMQPIRAMLADADVTEQQWRVLRVLYEEGETDANRVARRAVLFMSSMTRIAQTLEAKGLLCRRTDNNDRRKLLLDITEAGRRIIDDNAATSRAITESLRGRFGSERYEALLDLLNALDRLDG